MVLPFVCSLGYAVVQTGPGRGGQRSSVSTSADSHECFETYMHVHVHEEYISDHCKLATTYMHIPTVQGYRA